MIQKICVAGAGTMGMGIALAVAQHGFQTILFDIHEEVIHKAISGIEKNLAKLTEKGKITGAEKSEITHRILFTTDILQCKADLIIEAIIEKPEPKIELLCQLADLNQPDCILASNTSSLSVTQIQNHIKNPERFAGMHFFNPAHIMKLVELVKGNKTADDTIRALYDCCTKMNKTAVVCNDSPGFIVNRVARHFYLQSLHLVETGQATISQVDAAIQNAGFKMGPFALMDLIGMDINLAVSQSLYQAFDHAVRFKPSSLQAEKVAQGKLGKKTGEGFYKY